ncbi:MAG TPA: helix-turn-helix domain-containing protein [Limnochordales bacterium]
MPGTPLGERIRRTRAELGISGTQLARMIGKSQPYISDLERSQRTPSLRTLQALADALGKPITYFLTDEETEESIPSTLSTARLLQLRNAMAERIADQLLGSRVLERPERVTRDELVRMLEQAILNAYHDVLTNAGEQQETRVAPLR